MTRATQHPRGFAIVVALITVGLIGITLAGLMSQLSRDAVRNEAEAEHSQLRQLIIAGQSQMPKLSQPAELHLPEMLTHQGYSLAVRDTSTSGQPHHLTLKATRGKSHEQGEP